MFLSAGQTSDYIGARALLSSIPQAAVLLGDRGYDADWFRNALIDMGISPCIPSRACRKVPIPHDTELYRLHTSNGGPSHDLPKLTDLPESFNEKVERQI
jgi:IS5 family transposase